MEGNLFILFLPSRTIYNNKNLSFSPRMSRKNIQHLPFEYNTIIFGEDRKIGVGLLFRTKPVPNKNLDGSRRATGSSAGCRRLTSLITSDRIVENGFPPCQPSPCYHLSSRHRRSTRLSALDRGRIKATVEFDRRSAADPRMIPRLLSWYPPAWYLIRGEV